MTLSGPALIKAQLHSGWGSDNIPSALRGWCGIFLDGRGWVGEDLKAQWRTLYDFVQRRVRDPHHSEDITQETLSRLESYERGQSAESLDEALPSSLPLADEVVLQRQYLAAVQRVIDAMPPLRRDIFIRRRVNGDSPGEIALALGLSAAAVEKHLVRGLADLHAATRRGGTR